MEFTCNQDTFAKYLNLVSRIVNSKPGLPILNNALFETSKGKLNMSVTDLEIGLNCWIGAEVKASGKVTVPAKQLSEFVNSISGDQVDVALEKSTLSINTTNNKANLNTIPSDDYPAVASISEEKPIAKLRMEDVITAVNRVAFSAATDDIKPVMTAVRLEIRKDTIAFVAADGLRLSRQIMKMSIEAEEERDLLVPVKAMHELAYIVNEFSADDSQNLVQIYYIKDRNQIIFKYNDIELVARLIDGQYPPYQSAIPTGYQTRVELSKSDFQNSLKVVNIIARSVLGNKILFDVDPKANKLTLSASQADFGDNRSDFEGKVEGQELKIAFNAKFLTDMISHINSDDMVFECASSVSAGVFKIKGDDSFLHIVMPMRL